MKYFAFLLLVGVTVLVSACQPEAELYTEEKAIAAANWHLAEYAKKNNIPLETFKGPYVKEALGGPEYPIYEVCYKHPIHLFCYDHWIGRVEAGPFAGKEPASERMQWLEKQP